MQSLMIVILGIAGMTFGWFVARAQWLALDE